MVKYNQQQGNQGINYRMGNSNTKQTMTDIMIKNPKLRQLMKKRLKTIQHIQTNFLDLQTIIGVKPTMIIKQDQHKISPLLLSIQPRSQSILISEEAVFLKDSQPKPQQEVTNGNFIDDRQQQAAIDTVTNQYQYPFSCIGYLFVDFGPFQGYGTASLIYKNLIITAAHNIFDRKTGRKAQQIFFTPALNGCRGTPFQIQISPQTIFYPIQFQSIHGQTDKFDYAVISLGQDKDLSKNYGYLGIKFDWDNIQDQIFLYGYPQNKNQQNQGKNIYGMQKTVKEVDQNFIKYDIFTYSGMSGSPIFIKVKKQRQKSNKQDQKQDKNQGRKQDQKQDKKQDQQQFQYQMVGVHTSKDKSRKVNSGIRLNANIRKQVSEWIVKNNKKQGKQMNLLKCSIKSDQLIQILKSGNWQQLMQLKLGNNLLDHRAIQFLSSYSTLLPKLTQLSLFSNNIQFKGFNALFNLQKPSKLFPHLKRLNLQGNNILFKAGMYFYKDQSEAADLFPQLQVLFLSYNILGCRGIFQLCKCPKVFPNLRQLDLSGVQANDEGVKLLLKDSNLFPELRKLWLRFNMISSMALKYFLEYPESLKNLQWLSMTDNLIQDDGIAFLVASNQKGVRPLQKLVRLQLIKNRITQKGFKLLGIVSEDGNFMPSLKCLAIYQNQVSKGQQKELKQYLMQKIKHCEKILVNSHEW